MNFLIYRDGNVFVGQQIPELHHALSLPRQLAPAAGLFGILFYSLVFAAGSYETHGSEALAAGACDPELRPSTTTSAPAINCSATIRKAVRSSIFPTLALKA